jgi:hypothetical protein
MNLKHPFIVTSKLGWVDDWPKMSDDVYKALRAKNKAALADTQKAPEGAKSGTAKQSSGPEPTSAVGLQLSGTSSRTGLSPTEADKPIIPRKDPSAPSARRPQ